MSLAEFPRKVDYYAGNRGEACRCNVEHAEQVAPHSIETGANQNEIGFEISRCGDELGFKSFQNLCITRSREQRNIQNFPSTITSAGFRRRPSARICSIMVSTEVKDGTIFIKRLLGSIPMVVVPVHN